MRDMTGNDLRVLDLFCGAGGAGMGYSRAGFKWIVGVDIKPQPNYPFAFVQADAMTFNLDGYDFIHASPPCQAHTTLRALQGDKEYPDLIAPTRERLIASGKPFIMENVMGAPLLNPITLCGSSFGLRLRRHRLFESNYVLFQPPCRHYDSPCDIEILNHGKRLTRFVPVYGSSGGKAPHLWNEAMGIDWMTKAELTQAIPPAYTEWLGKQMLQVLEIAA